MQLELLPETFAICRLEKTAPFPPWASASQGLLCLARTQDEVSVVCEDRLVPPDARSERGWRAVRVAGTLDFSLTGVLARIAQPLAESRVSLFALSTFDTDYVLVREATLDAALRALESQGWVIKKT